MFFQRYRQNELNYFIQSLAAGFHCIKTFAAIDRLALPGLEGNFAILTATGTCCREHLSGSGISAIGSATL
jgi:hypothetical protein